MIWKSDLVAIVLPMLSIKTRYDHNHDAVPHTANHSDHIFASSVPRH